MIEAAGLNYTFAETIEANTVAFAVTGFSATALDIVSLQGDFAFSKVGTDIRALAVNVNARLGTGPVAIGVRDGGLGLVFTADGLAIEASGALYFEGGTFASVSAEQVTLRINQTGVEWTDELIEIGLLSYTFSNLEASIDLLAVNVVGLEARLLDAVYLRGDFAFGADGDLNTLTAVGSGIEAGLAVGSYGVGVVNASFGLFFDSAGKVAFEAQGTLFSDLPGDISLSADTVILKVNETSEVMTGVVLSVADADYTFNELPAASPDAFIELLVGGARLSALGFVEISGDFAFTASTASILLDNSDVVEVDTLLVGSNDLSAFVGLNGGSDDAIGFGLNGVSLALAILSDRADTTRNWTSLQMTADEVAFSEIAGTTISANTIFVAVNIASTDGRVIDYATQGLEIKTGPSTSITLNMDGSRGELLEASGTLDIDLFGFFTLNGDFAFEKSSDLVFLSDQSVVSVDKLTLGASGVNAFVGLNGGTAEALGFGLQSVDFALAILSENSVDVGDTVRSWTSLKANASNGDFEGIEGVEISGDTLIVAVNRAAVDGTLVDYTNRNLDVRTGADSTMALDLDGSRGELLEISGNLAINLFGFFMVSGGFAITKSTGSITLSDTDATELTVDQLTLGATNVSAFAGIAGGTSDALGFNLSNLDFALGIFTDQADPTRSWTALQATAGSFGFIGVEGLTISGSTLSVSINQAPIGGVVADFAVNPVAVKTGPANSKNLDLDGSRGVLLEVSGNVDVDVFGFLQLSGGFAFVKSETTVPVFYDEVTSDVAVELMTIGASGVNAFAGVGGTLGLELVDVDFALVLAQEKAAAARQWTALEATAGSASFIGIDGLTLTGDTLAVTINQASADGSLLDFAGAPLSVVNGPDSTFEVRVDGSVGPLLQVSGNLTIDLFGFFQVSGGFAIEKATDTVTLSDQSEIAVDSLTIGGSGVDAFAGINGGTSDALGFLLSDVDFGLALFSEVGGTARSFTSLRASAGQVGFVGVPDLSVETNNLVIEINRGQAGVVVDFSTNPYEIATGPDTTLELIADGALGELTRAAGELVLNVANFFSVSGSLSFEQSVGKVILADEDEVDVDRLLIGGTNLSAFVGLNGGSADAIGLQAVGVEFALALQSSQAEPSRKWVSLQGSAGAVSFVGITGLTIAADTLVIAINQADANGQVIDYSDAATDLTVATGPNAEDALTFDMDGASGALTSASGNLDIDVFGFFQVSGGFAFELQDQTLTLNDGTETSEIDARVLTIGGSNINAFAGINGGAADAVGLSLGEADFALALITDKANAAHKYTSLQATAGLAGFIGADVLTFQVEDLVVNVNQGITLGAEPEVVTTENTQWELMLPAGYVGGLNFTRNATTANVTIGASTSNADVIAGLITALEALDGIGVGNVSVVGNRIEGYVIELIGDLAGTDVAGIGVAAIAATPNTNVESVVEPTNAEAELKRITIVTENGTPQPVVLEISTATQSTVGGNEFKALQFTTPYASRGTYNLELVGSATVETVRFTQNDITNNRANIRKAFAALLGTGTSNIKVTFGSIDGGHQYDIT